MPRYRATVAEWTDGCGRELMLDPLSEITTKPKGQEVEGKATVQLARTMSIRSDGLFAIGPLHGIRELKAAHKELILSARRQLYIEGQFFRSEEHTSELQSLMRTSYAVFCLK